MFRCNSCDEFFFSVDVLRHDTSSRPVIMTMNNIKYCPLCGKEVEELEKRTIQKDR